MERLLMAALETRCVDPVHTNECKERLALLFEKGLKSPFGCNETITMRHDVLRSIFPGCRPTSVALCTWSLKRNCWLQDLALTWGEFWPWLVAVVTSTVQWSWNCSLANRLPKWPKNIFLPRWESSSAVYQVFLHRTNAVRYRPLFKCQQNGFFRSYQT